MFFGIATVIDRPAAGYVAAAATITSSAGYTYIYERSFFAVFINERKPPARGAAFLAARESTTLPILVTIFV